MTNAEEVRKDCCKPQASEKEQPCCAGGCDCSTKNTPTESKPSCC